MAGMGAAIAIACAAVALELAGEFDQRASYFRRHADQLQARLGRIEGRLVRADREVAEMRQDAEVREQFNQILAAPDGRLIRLEATDRHASMQGAIALSPAKAILEVSGVPHARSDQRYAIRWIRERSAPVFAAEFGPSELGKADVVFQLSPPPREVSGVIVSSLTPETGSEMLFGQPLLRGEIRATKKH